jgi:mRNA interferase MazF
MRRGDIRLVTLDAAAGTGGERSVGHLAVIVSNDGANETARRLGQGVVTIVPVMPLTGRTYPFQVVLRADFTGLPRDGKAQAEQVRWITVSRIGDRVGVVPLGVMGEINAALRLHLSL